MGKMDLLDRARSQRQSRREINAAISTTVANRQLTENVEQRTEINQTWDQQIAQILTLQNMKVNLINELRTRDKALPPDYDLQHTAGLKATIMNMICNHDRSMIAFKKAGFYSIENKSNDDNLFLIEIED